MISQFEVSSQGTVHLRLLGDQGEVLHDYPRVLSVRDAGRLLKRSRRHLYRYIQQGWLTPVAKFSGEFFFDPQDVKALQGNTHKRQRALPQHLAALFPDYDLRRLHVDRDADLILSRVLEQGDTRALRWALKQFPASRRRLFLKTQGLRRLSPRALRFWSWLWKVRPLSPAPSWRTYGMALGGMA